MKITLIAIILANLIIGCSTTNPRGRVYVDSSDHRDNVPEWAQGTKTTWEKDGKIFIRSNHEVRGDERVNGCMDLARLDNQEILLTEIKAEVRGKIDQAQTSLAENSENLLGKVRSTEFTGSITGFRSTDEYWTRYRIGETEHVQCNVLAEIKQADYDRVKRAVIDKVEQIDPRVKESVAHGQIQFFQKKMDTAAQPVLNNRAPANDSSQDQ